MIPIFPTKMNENQIYAVILERWLASSSQTQKSIHLNTAHIKSHLHLSVPRIPLTSEQLKEIRDKQQEFVSHKFLLHKSREFRSADMEAD